MNDRFHCGKAAFRRWITAKSVAGATVSSWLQNLFLLAVVVVAVVMVMVPSGGYIEAIMVPMPTALSRGIFAFVALGPLPSLLP